MGVNSLPKTVTRQRRGCDLNPGPSAPESSTLTTRLSSHPTNCTQPTYCQKNIDGAKRCKTLDSSRRVDVGSTPDRPGLIEARPHAPGSGHAHSHSSRAVCTLHASPQRMTSQWKPTTAAISRQSWHAAVFTRVAQTFFH